MINFIKSTYYLILLMIACIALNSCEGCKNLSKEPSFHIELQVDSGYLFTHQKKIITLDIQPREGFTGEGCSVKELTVTKGKLCLEVTGEELHVGQKLTFGKHQLLFEPTTGERGEVCIEMTLMDEKGREATTGLMLELDRLALKVSLQADNYNPLNNRYLFPYQDAKIILHISSSANQEEADQLTYSLKEITVQGGKLLLASTGEELQANSTIVFDKQELLFRPEINLKEGNTNYYNNAAVGEGYIHLKVIAQSGEYDTELKLIISKAPFIAKMWNAYSYIYSYQTEKIELSISSDRVKVDKLDYFVQDLEVSKGQLFLASTGEEIKTGTKLQFGKQNLIFQPEKGEAGEALIKLTIANDQKETCVAELKIEIQPTDFRAKLEAENIGLYVHKEAKLALEISSYKYEEGAENLNYSVKEIEVSKGKLFLEATGEELKVVSPLSFGKQDLLFKPNGEIGEADIKLVVTNGKDSKKTVEIKLYVKPIKFKVITSLEKLREADKTYPILKNSDVGKLNIQISDVDQGLREEVWKLVAWNFTDGITRKLVTASDLKELKEFPLTFGANLLYLGIDKINIGTSPRLQLTIEGPGKVIKEVDVPLSTLQNEIVSDRTMNFLFSIIEVDTKIGEYLSQPLNPSRRDEVKELSKLAQGKIEWFGAFYNELKKDGPWWQSPALLNLSKKPLKMLGDFIEGGLILRFMEKKKQLDTFYKIV